MSMYWKFKIEYFWAKNMFIRSNMAYSYGRCVIRRRQKVYIKSSRLSALLTPSDVTLPIKKSILGILNIFLAKEYSILNFLHILTDTFWCHISFTGVHIWPNEHISGRKVLDSKLSMHTHWFALILCAPYMKPFWPTEKYLWQISPWWWNFYTKALTLGATSNRQ